MGGRRLSIEDPDRIVDDWPCDRTLNAQERRKAGYRAEREKLAQERAQPPVQIAPEFPEPVQDDFKFPLPSPEEYFPDWDWLLAPWGPPDDYPGAKAYRDIQERALREHLGLPLDDPAPVAYVEPQREAQEEPAGGPALPLGARLAGFRF